MIGYGPQVLAEGVGFQRPTPGAMGALPSSPRASNPRLEQGGSVKALIRGLSAFSEFTPQSGLDCRRLASPGGFANPTTPAAAVVEPFGPPTVPSGLRPSADAGVE